MLRGDLLEKFPHSKFALPHIRVVKEHDGVFGKLGAPEREVSLDVIVEVAAVDVEQVDRSFVEVLECVLECRTNQAREGRILLTVARDNGLEHALVIEPRVLVTFPSIDGVGSRTKPEPVDGLAESEIGIAVVCSELDDTARSQLFADPKGKGRMLDPGR